MLASSRRMKIPTPAQLAAEWERSGAGEAAASTGSDGSASCGRDDLSSRSTAMSFIYVKNSRSRDAQNTASATRVPNAAAPAQAPLREPRFGPPGDTSRIAGRRDDARY